MILKQQNKYLSIISQIDQLNSQNKRLMTIVNHAQNTSFLKVSAQSISPIIKQIQQDMRASFNALIEGVKEYFIAIDVKIKEIALLIEQKLSQSSQLHQSKHKNYPIKELMHRVQYLEENLKKTQQNQRMTQREFQQQSTLIKSKQVSFHQKVNDKSMYNKSFRIFSDAEEKAYPRPYSMIDSIQEIEPQKQQSFCFSGNYLNNIRSIPMAKRSLKGSDSKTQTPNKTHRMSYMMQYLKN